MRLRAVVRAKDQPAYFHYNPSDEGAVKSATVRVSNFPTFLVFAILRVDFETKPIRKKFN
jgi:hypothetical protein